jgi:hypothetical protein
VPPLPPPDATLPRRTASADPAAPLPEATLAGAKRERLPVPDPAPAEPGAAAPVWTVDGRALTTADLGDFVLRYSPDLAAEALDRLLDEAVVALEAAREEVTVPGAVVAARTDAWIADRKNEVRVQFGAATDFETHLRERWGRDLASYRADAERIVRAVCLRDRLVRLDQLRLDGVEVRVLVLATEEAATAAAGMLRGGADMTLYAERNGLRRPASPAPVARGDVPEKDAPERLFAASAGDVLDPVPFEAPGRGTHWQVYKVTRAWRGDAAPWTALAAKVEASIAASPVTGEEVVRWRRRAFARHRLVPEGATKGWLQDGAGPSIEAR